MSNLLWSRRWESNPQSELYESPALPLSHVGLDLLYRHGLPLPLFNAW